MEKRYCLPAQQGKYIKKLNWIRGICSGKCLLSENASMFSFSVTSVSRSVTYSPWWLL